MGVHIREWALYEQDVDQALVMCPGVTHSRTQPLLEPSFWGEGLGCTPCGGSKIIEVKRVRQVPKT